METLKACVENKLTGATNNDPSPYFRSFKQDDAVDAFGQKLRVYLQCVDLLSMNGKQLDHEPRVINFDHKCEENKIKYYNSYPNTVGSYERIFITTEDRSRFHDVNNKTKSEIQKSILNILKQIEEAGGAEEAEVLRGQWSKEIKTGTKDLYLSFYKEVVQALEEVTSKDRNESAAETGEPV